ncbi:GlmU family protein [Schleiferiaceae bacterium]|jgi:UDP-N-acetylglucosamine diphosphorylase/glucosamine-1-phosphate N-acetyltransferase|nr:GlmU family protein [Schleiferiaceae bacterium]
MKIQLVDGKHRDHLLPLTYTRPVAQLRCGILTIAEKYQKRGFEVGYETEDYLQEKFPSVHHDILVSGSVCPTDSFIDAITSLTEGQALIQDDQLLAFKGANWADTPTEIFPFNDVLNLIIRPWDIWTKNAAEMNIDFDVLTKDRFSAPIDSSNTVFGDRIFLEEGARVKASILNATSGPIYLAQNAEVMEGSIVRGGLALGAHSALKLGTKVYGATTLGPHCKVGGEINNSVILGYSNKGHDGFLGNSAIGEWCNLGADTNNSNLKNNYDEVKAWSYVDGRFSKTGQQFCGLIMGDHSKSGINTMFNTGTVVGVSANVYGAGFPRNFIPSFTWGGPQGTTEYMIKKALDTANRMMQRRGLQVDDVERTILEKVYADSAKYRN